MYFKRETWLINSIKTIIKIKRVKEVIALKTITDCRKKNIQFSKALVLLDNYTDSEFKEADFNGEYVLKEKRSILSFSRKNLSSRDFFSINYISMQPLHC
jgi:uncharacterized protein YjbI with pentapeptide repeats